MVRVVSINDGGICWEGNSVKAAKAHLKHLQEYSRRIGQSAADLRVKRYIGDGEWQTVRQTGEGLS